MMKMAKKILIIEPELIYRELIAAEFSGIISDYIFVLNGKVAVKHIKQAGLPDIIITELAMPIMDGINFINILIKAKVKPKQLIILYELTPLHISYIKTHLKKIFPEIASWNIVFFNKQIQTFNNLLKII